NVVAIGVTFAWLFSMTLLPALVLLMPSGVSASVVDSRATHGGMSKLSALVIRHHRPLLYAGSALVILFSLLVPRNTLNDVWAEYFDKSTLQRQSSDYARAHLTSTNSVAFS